MKKLLITFIALMLIITGCGKKNANNDKEDKVNEQATADFKEYQIQELVGFLSSNKLNAHFAYKNLADWGLEDMEATLGDIEEDYDFTGFHDSLEALHKINRDGLSNNDKNLYDRYEKYLNNQLLYEGNVDYDYYFTPGNGLNVNLLTTFTEFVIREERDIKDMITYLSESEDYLKACVDYTKKQAEKGFEQAKSTMEGIIEQCQRFVDSKGHNEVAKAVNEQIDEADYLTDSQKEDYKKQVTEISDDKLINGYQAIIDYYTSRLDKTTSSGRLGETKEGKQFYDALLKNKTSSSMNALDTKKLLLQRIQKDLSTLTTLYRKNPNAYFSEKPDYGYNTPEEILENIISKMTDRFPKPADVEYSIDYLDPSVTSDSIAAYYLTPPMDDIKNGNVMKVNPSAQNGLYTTIAHEGYPGHCYQITYEYTNRYSELLPLISFIGFTEGWAMYIEGISLNYSKISDPDSITMLEIEELLFYEIMSVVDIMVNAENADVDDVGDFVEDYYGRENAEIFYNLAIDDPGLYLPYGVGYVQLKNLREYAEKELGKEFDEVAFHKEILECGTCDFDYLSNRIETFIKDNK